MVMQYLVGLQEISEDGNDNVIDIRKFAHHLCFSRRSFCQHGNISAHISVLTGTVVADRYDEQDC